jgi:hypothetical protein
MNNRSGSVFSGQLNTALLLSGMLTCAAFFARDVPEEAKVRSIVDTLYRRAEWDWALNSELTMSMGWKSAPHSLK